MAAKSILEVEIKDGAFKDFQSRFQKYQKQLKNLPGQWGAVGKSIQNASGKSIELAARASLIAQKFKEADTFAKKLTLTLKAADRTTTSLARHTGTMARNIKDATASLLKWGGLTSLFSGLLGAGGLFGIARLAEGVSGGQAQAGRAGVSYGADKAAQTAYGQLLGGAGGVQATLEAINVARTSFGLYGGKPVFDLAGMKRSDWEGKSAAEILPKYLEAAQKKYAYYAKATQGKGQGTLSEATGLTGILDIGTLTQLSGANLTVLKQQYDANKRSLDLSQGTQNAWSNFDRVLTSAGQQIENVFIRGITPLLPAFTKLSTAITHAIATVLGSPQVNKWVSGAGVGLEKFAKYLTSPDFKDDMNGFLEGVDRAGGALWDFASAVMKITGKIFDIGGGLTASEHQAIEKIRAINPKMAEKLEYAERHKERHDVMAQVALMMQEFRTGKGGQMVEGKIGHGGGMTANQKTVSDVAVKLHILNGTGGDLFTIANGAGAQ